MLTRRSAAIAASLAVLAACSAPAEFVTAPRTVTVTTTATVPPVVTIPPPVTTSATISDDESASTAMTSPGTSSSTPASEPETPPAPTGFSVTDADRQRAADIVAGLSLADRAASVIMVTGSNAIGSGLLAKHPFGGVILFAPGGVLDGTSNGTPTEVRAVTQGLRADAGDDPTGVAPLIATDQEYGLVQRLTHGFTTFPDAATYGRIDDLDRASSLARRAATAAAKEMRAVGVTVNFAPVFGVLPADGSASAIGRYGRSYGIDPQRVATLVSAVVTGYQAGGVVATLKHFPGIARIAEDSHVTLPTFTGDCADWNSHEAIPARAGVQAGVAMVMTGHVRFPAVDDRTASLSPVVIGDLLRGDGADGCDGLGFDGVTVTDSMQMQPITENYDSAQAAVAALSAGEDLLLMPANPIAAVAGIVAAVQDGTLDEARLDEAATAVLAVRIAAEAAPTPKLKTVGSAKHRKLADAIRAEAG